jgi:hypothetical protein
LGNWNSGEEKGKQDYTSLRVGHDFPHWQGVQDDPDPSSLPPGALPVGENIRLKARGKYISERPGVTVLNSSAMTGAVVGIFDERVLAGVAGNGFPSGRGVRLLASVRGLYRSDGSEASYAWVNSTPSTNGIGAVDESLSSTAQGVLSGSSSQQWGPLFMDTDGTVYIGLVELSGTSWIPYLCSFTPTPIRSRTDPLVSFQAAPAKLCRIPMAALGTGAYPVITSITRSAAYLYIAVTGWSDTQDGETGWSGLSAYPPYDTDAKVYRWDGKTISVEKTVTPIDSEPRVIKALLHPFGELLVASFNQERDYNESTAIGWHVRNSAGTWSAITDSTSPAVDATHRHALPQRQCQAIYKDALYIGGGAGKATSGAMDARILKYDRTSLTTARRITGILGDPDDKSILGVVGLQVVGEYLYYLHTQSASGEATQNTYLGRFDGSSWSDTYATVVASAAPSARIALGMARQNGKLYAILALLDSLTFYVYEASESALTSWSLTTTWTQSVTPVPGFPQSYSNNAPEFNGWLVPV